MILGKKGGTGTRFRTPPGKGPMKLRWIFNPKYPSNQPKPNEVVAAPTSPAPPVVPEYKPTELTIGEGSNVDNTNTEPQYPEMPPQQFAPGGAAAGVDGNASGFRRKKSSARMTGLTSKGTSQFKINGQFRRSTGLNIGT